MTETLQAPIDPESMSSGLLGCGALVLIALIAFGVIISYRLFVVAPVTAGWPTARAEISQSEAGGYTFTYTVAGQRYESPARTRFGTTLEALTSGDPAGRTVTVHVSPNNPNRAILLPSTTEPFNATTLVGPFLALIGVSGLVWLVRHTDSPRFKGGAG